MSVTDEIKSRIDIVSYVQRHVPELKKAGRNHKACCPFHNEKTPSFVVNPERGTWHCFGACSEGGDLFTFAQKIHGWDFKEALRELAAEAGLQLRAQTPEQKTQSDRLDGLRGLVKTAAELFQGRLHDGTADSVLAYLRETRGLRDETIKAFELGYAPESWDWLLKSLRGLGYGDDDIVEVGLAVRNENGRVYDRFRNRLMIPIRDERGRAVGFGGRALASEDGAKYINSPQSAVFDKSRLLFGLDSARRAIRESGTAVIVEGYLDVIQAHQAGYFNVAAQMGTAMTEKQIRLIAPRYARKIVLALDADEAGQNAARRSLDVARQALSDDFAGRLSVDLRILQMPEGKDPDDLLRKSPARWESLVANAQALADFVIGMETTSLSPGASLQERQSVALALLPILLASENNLYKQDNIQKLSRRLRISERELLSWAAENAPSTRPVTRAAAPEAPGLDAPPPEYWLEDFADMPGEAEGGSGADEGHAGGAGGRHQRAIEPYCMSLLLKNPNLLYLANRKLRELAGDDDDLLNGPLSELGVDDFSRSQYRTLMAHLLESMTQHDQEPLEYLASVIDEELQGEYETLLLNTPTTIARLLRRNFEAELIDIFRGHQFQIRHIQAERDELISRALQLRLSRLENERIEMQYLQEEAQTGGEQDPRQNDLLNVKIMLSMRAKARLNRAVGRHVYSTRQASIS
ncbi:MAG: DNA primase [Chloroflexota bacterium]|nr:DNA primase [Chloroflexota bacterium]